MHLVAMIADWPRLQDLCARGSAEGELTDALDATGTDWLAPATATQDYWKVVLDEEAGQVFDAIKPHLAFHARAVLQEFLVCCCSQQWQGDEHRPPRDLAFQEDELNLFLAAIEPTRVRHCLVEMQQLDLDEVMALTKRTLPLPGLRLIKTDAQFREFMDMWLNVFREATAKGWGVVVMRS